MVFNATFNNISVVLLVEEVGVPIENHRPALFVNRVCIKNKCFFNEISS